MPMRYRITAPYNGDRTAAGVRFTAGTATVLDPDPGALLYFRRRGYRVEDDPPQPPKNTKQNGPPDSPPTGRSAARNKRG